MTLRQFEMTVRIGCPVMCEYCPQAALRAARARVPAATHKLTEPNLTRIIENVSEGRHRVGVVFAGFAEPFSVPNAVELFAAAQHHRAVEWLSIFTTAEGMTRDDLVRTTGLSKLRRLYFHVRPPGDYALMRGGSGVFWEMLPDVEKYAPDAPIFLIDTHVAEGEVDRTLAALEPFGLAGNLRLGRWHSRSKNKVTVMDERKTVGADTREPVICAKTSWEKQPVVLPSGDSLACCNDYSCELPIGNLLRAGWSELDFGTVSQLQRHPERHPGAPCFRSCHFARSRRGSRLRRLKAQLFS